MEDPQPFKKQAQILLDGTRNIFVLSTPIFFFSFPWSKEVDRYAEVRKHHRFLPHQTFFLRQDSTILLVQEIPYQERSSLREHVHRFIQKGKESRRLLFEISLEERLEMSKQNFA